MVRHYVWNFDQNSNLNTKFPGIAENISLGSMMMMTAPKKAYGSFSYEKFYM